MLLETYFVGALVTMIYTVLAFAGAVIGALIGVLTGPSFMGVKVPLGVLTSSARADAAFKAELTQHLILTTVIGLIIGVVLAFIVGMLRKPTQPKTERIETTSSEIAQMPNQKKASVGIISRISRELDWKVGLLSFVLINAAQAAGISMGDGLSFGSVGVLAPLMILVLGNKFVISPIVYLVLSLVVLASQTWLSNKIQQKMAFSKFKAKIASSLVVSSILVLSFAFLFLGIMYGVYLSNYGEYDAPMIIIQNFVLALFVAWIACFISQSVFSKKTANSVPVADSQVS